MKKYFHQYTTQTNQNLYGQSQLQHPFLNNKHTNKSLSLHKQNNNNTTHSFFKTNLTPKSNLNELNLNNVTNNKNANNKKNKKDNNNDQQKTLNSQSKHNKSTLKNNDLISQPSNTNSNNHHKHNTIRQSIESQSLISQHSSSNTSRVKQRGFSLQYLKMAKRHKIKQMFNHLNSQQSSILTMINGANNNLEQLNNRNIRSKTTFDEPLNNRMIDNNDNDIDQLANNHHLRSTQYNHNHHHHNHHHHINHINHNKGLIHNNNNNNPKQLSLLGNAQDIRNNLLLNKTLNDLKLPKTSSFLINNNNNINSNKTLSSSILNNSYKKRVNPLLTRIQFAGNILNMTNQRKANNKTYNDNDDNNPISFIPIDSVRLNSDRKFFHSNSNNNINNNNNLMNGTMLDIGGKKTLKKSKYSPFKSRNGSAASHNQDMRDIVQSKQFQNDSQFKIKPFTIQKDVKTYKLTRHKRIKTLNSNHKNVGQQNDQPRYLDIADRQHTIKVIQQGLYGQVRLLCQLKECFQIGIDNNNSNVKQLQSQSPRNNKTKRIPINKIKQLVKIYVFGQKDKYKQENKQKQKQQLNNQKQQQKQQQQQQQKQQQKQQKKYHNTYFSQLDHIFLTPQQKHLIKKVISCQRLLIICIIDLLSHQKLLNLVEQLKLTILTLIVIYLIVWKQVTKLETYQNIDIDIAEYFDGLLKVPNYKTQTLLQKHLKISLLPYIQNLFRYSKQLYQKQCKKLIEQSKTRTINRTFYQTLKKYAIYLTNNEQRMVNKLSAAFISSFATCPAPYILTRSQKRYTLCVDLDETLLYSKFSCAKKFQTIYRPGAKQFIIQLNKYFQIIVFTSSVKEYADQVIKPFVQFIDHSLYRYYVTRGKNLTNTVKDLSRIGRRLQKVIFIDDLQCNIKLQPQNSIKVTPWKGDNNDKEIVELKGLLLALGKDEMEYDDVRPIVSQIKNKMKVYCGNINSNKKNKSYE